MLRKSCLVLLTFVSVKIPAADSFRLLPAELNLDGREATHRIMVERFDGDRAIGVASGSIVLKSDNPQIVSVNQGAVVPVADGATTIRALRGQEEIAAAAVAVTNSGSRFRWTFRNHVQSVLAKQGCNSGACHGALAGKGGFRLSLRGYDTDKDYFNAATQQLGRRVDLTEPGLSLLLTKPTTAVPHRGGLRLTPDTLNYRVVSEWIADGAPEPADEDARLVRLEVLPEAATLKKNQQQPFIIRAYYTDGRVEDVTQWAKFTSANEAVATVGPDGIATVIGPGEGAVSVWFGSRIVIARLTSPFEQTVTPNSYVLAGRRNFIDDLGLKQLRRLNLKPSPKCPDEVFVRRAFIDTIGTLPTALEVRKFLADGSPGKRDALIESLLTRSEFVDFWSYQWSDLLMINGNLLRPDAVKAYYGWIHDHVAANTPWDDFVREVITARGSSIENGATNFYALHQAPEDMAENASQAFLGLSIGCAKCHNHPLEKWTNDQYYSFANLFSRVRAKGWGGDPRSGDGKRTLVTVDSGELIQPRTGKPQPPAPLDAQPLPYDAPVDRREYLADWLVSGDNPLFARSITNRVWRNFMGVGLVEQVDDMRSSNPASNEELLQSAADYLVDNDFNLKTLMRQILQSETYQRSSKPLNQNNGDARNYSRYYPKRLMAEVLLDAVSQVTAVPSEFNKIVFSGADVRDTDFYPAGTRAIELYDAAVQSYFLQTFGRHQRRITCECERSDEPSMVQVLHISNGTTINGKLQTKDNQLDRWLAKFMDNRSALLDELFLSSLSRYPADRERSEMLQLFTDTKPEEHRELLEDIAWGIFSSREFLFNH
ncbi:MAG: DUF1553 domain-containing protein [Fuerstiella sp.]|nr:DUF1553 domain-containing protein [Fuerstiella sp.]MCP4509509.1 DUF1553 domain-containing protein [Fuerstiella sp.]